MGASPDDSACLLVDYWLKLCLSWIPLSAKDSKPTPAQRLKTPRLKQPLSDCTVRDGSEADATSKGSAAQSHPAGTTSWQHNGKQMADSCTFATSAYFSSSDMKKKQTQCELFRSYLVLKSV